MAGFTLVEVIVAFAILALLLPPLFQAISGGLRTTDRTRDQIIAVLLAESALASAGTDGGLRTGITEGTFGDGFLWRVAVRPFDDHSGAALAAPAVRPYEVTVTVSWDEGGAAGGLLELTTLKLVAEGRR
jgi:general secretion pathway protein I